MKAIANYDPNPLFTLESEIPNGSYFLVHKQYPEIGIVIEYEEPAGIDGVGDSYPAKPGCFVTLVPVENSHRLAELDTVSATSGVTTAVFRTVCEHYFKGGMLESCQASCSTKTVVYSGHGAVK